MLSANVGGFITGEAAKRDLNTFSHLNDIYSKFILRFSSFFVAHLSDVYFSNNM